MRPILFASLFALGAIACAPDAEPDDRDDQSRSSKSSIKSDDDDNDAPSAKTKKKKKAVDPEPAPAVEDAEEESVPAETPAPSVPATDIAGTPECDAWCTKLVACGYPACRPKEHCEIPVGLCAEATRKYRECQVKTGRWSCTSGGYTIATGECDWDKSLCTPTTTRK